MQRRATAVIHLAGRGQNQGSRCNVLRRGGKADRALQQLAQLGGRYPQNGVRVLGPQQAAAGFQQHLRSIGFALALGGLYLDTPRQRGAEQRNAEHDHCRYHVVWPDAELHKRVNEHIVDQHHREQRSHNAVHQPRCKDVDIHDAQDIGQDIVGRNKIQPEKYPACQRTQRKDQCGQGAVPQPKQGGFALRHGCRLLSTTGQGMRPSTVFILIITYCRTL